MSMSSSSSLSLEEFIRKEVGEDWEDEVKVTARFKAFSGQRSDWESNYYFWRDLILKVARHLGIFLIRPAEVKNIWFNRGGLIPLCLDHVLLEMYNAGEVLRTRDLVDPTSGQLSRILRRVTHLVGLGRSSAPEDLFEDHIILSTLLKEKAIEIVNILSEDHWASSCIITMRKFHDICGGSGEASAVLSYLSGCEKAKHVTVSRGEFIEGVKVSPSSAPVSGITSLDCNLLHLIWTAEKLQQQLDLIDQRYETSRKLALASLQSGNKKLALRHARRLKLASESREKCTTFLNRVEEVLKVIDDAESSKKVSEAIQIGVHTIKENTISLEEVQLCLKELDESIDTQKQVEKVLESTPSVMEIEDEDIEDEFRKLELEVKSEYSQVSIFKVGPDGAVGRKDDSETAESLGHALSNLKLMDSAVMKSVTKDSMNPKRNNLKDLQLEAV